MSYYSLISSLPIINLDSCESISEEEFLNFCFCHLNDDEMSIITDLLNNKKISDNDFINKYYNFETQIKNSISKIRCQKYNIDSKSLINQHNEYSGSIEESLNKAYSLDNPLLVEIEIDRIFFNALDDLVGNNYFSFSKIISYALQLKIVLRWKKMNDDDGYNYIEKVISNKTTSNEVLDLNY